MLCERCNQNKATLFVSEYKDDEIKGYYLCNDCAKTKENMVNLTNPEVENVITGILDMVLGANLKKVRPSSVKEEQLTCDNCQTTSQEFMETGKFGCSNCYKTFDSILKNVIQKIQPSNEHNGKIPAKLVHVIANREEIISLKQNLKDAISKEEYEEAAKLRDKIKELEKEEK